MDTEQLKDKYSLKIGHHANGTYNWTTCYDCCFYCKYYVEYYMVSGGERGLTEPSATAYPACAATCILGINELTFDMPLHSLHAGDFVRDPIKACGDFEFSDKWITFNI